MSSLFPRTASQAQDDGLFTGKWATAKPMQPGRSETAAVVVDGLIYVPGGFGGPERFEVYDPQKDEWRKLAPLPDGRHHLMTAALNGRVYVFGGALANWTPTNTTWVYDPKTDGWQTLQPMPERRRAGAAVALGDYLYVIGGEGGTQALLRYDPKTDAWTKWAELTEAREHVAAAALVDESGKEYLYAIGGRWRDVGGRQSVERYDPETDQWTATAPMNTARSGFGAAVLEQAGKRYIAVSGGEVFANPPVALASAEVYDLAADKWLALPDMPVGLHGNPVAALGDRLYVLGGSIKAAAIENPGDVYVYTPKGLP
jgi:N-acetylneuraminic acid mutarotase